MIVDIDKFSPHRHVKEPFKHQQESFNTTRGREYYGLFWEMGTGKTKPLIDTISWLFLTRQIDGALIVSDKGAYLNWPMIEIPTHMQPDLLEHTRIGCFRATARGHEVRDYERVLVAQDDILDIACINIEALSHERPFQWARSFLINHHAIMIIDESTSIKNQKSARTINVRRLGELADYRRIATGTPITQGPLDLFSQCQFLKPGCLGHTSFTSFKATYAVERQMIFGKRRFQQIVGYRNLDNLAERIKPFTSRLTKDECLDLPEKIYEIEMVEMTTEQSEIYDKLKNEALVMLDQGMVSCTEAITAIEKLHQVCCGHVKTDDHITVNIPNNRVTTLLRLREIIDGKMIIWCAYQRDVENVMAALAELKRDQFAVHYYGKTTPDERVNHLQQFHDNPLCTELVGTTATGGKGLTLNEASYTVYYSNNYRLEHRLQSEDRNHRIGQKRNVTYIDLAIPNTIDMRIIKLLKEKKDLASEVLDLNRLIELLN